MNLTELDEQSLQKSMTGKEENPGDEVLYEEEEKYTLFEKIKHNKWQIRRKAYFEISELITQNKLPTQVDGENLTIEMLVPILQNMLYEQNLIAIVDGLRAIKAFLCHHSLTRSYLTAFTTSLMDKLVLTKT
jgi:hypothetical protein